MVEEKALVLSIDNEHALVRTQRMSACESCKLKAGCGQNTLAKLGGEKVIEFSVRNTLQAKEGDVVIVAIPESGLLMASTMMFIVPLILMAMFASFATLMSSSQLIAAGLGFAGLLTGFWFARRYAALVKTDARFTPTMSVMALAATDEAKCRTTLNET
jgi:sigma-E factor negative regulatory protein RseC